MRLMVIAVVAVELQCFVPWSSVVVLNQFACVRAMCVKVLKHYRKSLVLLQAKLFVDSDYDLAGRKYGKCTARKSLWHDSTL